MRRKNGAADPASSGTYIHPNGTVAYLKAADFILTPLQSWRSPATAAAYPIRWRIQIPRLALNIEVTTPVPNQELALPAVAYWEGLIHAAGTVADTPVTAHGYLELTGYQHPLTGMTQ
jgi:predicted secreted hydrolase